MKVQHKQECSDWSGPTGPSAIVPSPVPATPRVTPPARERRQEAGPRFLKVASSDSASCRPLKAPGPARPPWTYPGAGVALPDVPHETNAAGGPPGGPGSAGGADAVLACAAHGADSTKGGTSVLHCYLFNIPRAGLGPALQAVYFNGFGGCGHNRRLLFRRLPGL